MEARAQLRQLRMSPKKVRLVVDVIRGLDVTVCRDQLRFINKTAVTPVKKLLESAIANAKNNFGLREDNLYVKEIMVDEGPRLKRFMPRAFGRAASILRRTSHIKIILSERIPTVREEKKETGSEVHNEKNS